MTLDLAAGPRAFDGTWLLTIGIMLASLVAVAEARDQHPAPAPIPTDLVIGLHTYIDVGPPFSFYELISLHADDKGTSVERLKLTPAGNTCLQPARAKRVRVVVEQTISSLLGGRSPCSIPEKQLRRERRRRQKALVFSGGDVVIEVPCGNDIRRLEMEILDRDLFDPAPRTPQNTSWTMQLLGRIADVTGPGVLDRRLIPIPEDAPPAPAPPSALSERVSRGEFDSLFGNAPDKLSTLWADTQRPPSRPSIELQSDSPFRPLSLEPLRYPDLGLLALVDGRVVFRFTVVTPDATVSDFRFVRGHPIFDDAVLAAAKQWRFPPEAVGQEFEGAIEFKTNCPAAATDSPRQ